MILPINRVYGESCIFCGSEVGKDGEKIVLKDGKKIIATRRFHRECYLDNAQESKRVKYEKV